MDYAQQFKDPEFCKQEILEARKAFNRKIPIDSYDGLLRALFLMLIHCPDSMESLVDATILEAEMRFKSGLWVTLT